MGVNPRPFNENCGRVGGVNVELPDRHKRAWMREKGRAIDRGQLNGDPATPLTGLKGATLRAWVLKALDPDTRLVTDASASLGCAGEEAAT
jgi:hypothetical protein